MAISNRMVVAVRSVAKIEVAINFFFKFVGLLVIDVS